MQEKDPVSQELRLIENEVDSYYEANPLMQLPFGVSAWYFMAFCEDIATMALLKGDRATMHQAAAFADGFVVHLKNPFQWLYSSCQRGGTPKCVYEDDIYQASSDLSRLSDDYRAFET